jgi:uncharacterized tellurite resistance protein B-like protein
VRAILGFLGLQQEPAAAAASGGDVETIRRIANELDKLEPDRARYVAAFAFVLSRVARADHEVTDDETKEMERLVVEKGGLPADQAVLVVQMAKTQQLLFGGTDDFLVTRELGRLATHDDKLHVIDCLYAVASSDRRILVAEANEIARIARELRVEHADLSEIRYRYRDLLAARTGLDPDSS